MSLSVLRAYFHRHIRGSSPQFVIDRTSAFKRMGWVSWSPDGTAIAMSTPEGVQLRDAHDGTLLHQWEGGPALAWSPDGTALVAQWLPDAEHVMQWTFQIWERATGESLCTYRSYCGGFVYALAWSPDGTRIAHSTSSDREGQIYLWNTETGSPLLEYHGHSHSHDVHTLSWSPDSAFLVSRDSDGITQVWQSADGTLVHQLTEHGSSLSGNAVWSPVGHTIATDGIALTIWDALTGEMMSRYRSGGRLSKEAWSPDGKLLALIEGDLITLVNRWTGKQERVYGGHLRDKPLLFVPPKTLYGPTSLSWSPDGTRIASMDVRGRVHVWQTSVPFPWLPTWRRDKRLDTSPGEDETRPRYKDRPRHKERLLTLLLNTEYSSGNLTVIVHAYKRRRSFRPIPNRFEPGWKIRGQPETWFVELDCTLKNSANYEVYVRGQLKEVLPDDAKPDGARTLSQMELFYPLSDDDTRDIVAGSNFAVRGKPSIMIEDTRESKLFFKLDESMKMQAMAFSLLLSHTGSGPYQEQNSALYC